MRKYPEKPDNKEYSQEECKKITRTHRKSVMKIMGIFCNKLKDLGRNHDKDKETPENLEKYTYLLNHPNERAIKNGKEYIIIIILIMLNDFWSAKNLNYEI